MSTKQIMDFSPVLLILILLCGAAHALEDNRCWWKATLCEIKDPVTGLLACFFANQAVSGGMEKQQLSNKVDPIIKSLEDQPVDTKNINYFGFPYGLRIDLGCDNKLDAMTAMKTGLFTGLTPLVILTIGQPVHPTIIKPQNLDITMTAAPLQDGGLCENELCNFGWYVPFPILNGSVVYRIQIISNGLGMGVVDKSYSINVNGLITTQGEENTNSAFGTMGYQFKEMLSLSHPSRPIWPTSKHAPVMIIPGIPGSKAVIFTASEFKNSILIEMGIKSCWVGSYSCPQETFDGKIQEAIIMENTVIIRQNQLLHRFLGNYSLLPLKAKSSGAWEEVMRSVCVRKMVPIPTVHGGKEFFYVLGGGVNYGSVYRADIEDGDITFSELQDSKGRSVCRFMSDHFKTPINLCIIRSVSQRGDKKQSDIVVAKFMYSTYDWTYFVMIHDKDFHVRGRLPTFIPEDRGDSFIVADNLKPQSDRFVIINGIEYNPYSRIIYFWGSTLLCSLDEGQTFLFVRGFDVEESSIQFIKYFRFSYHGEFFFVTTLEQVWWGQEGMDRVAPLRPSLGWSTFQSLQMLKGQDISYRLQMSLLTVFWDANKNLQEVVYIEQENRVVKREIPVAEISSYSVFTLAPPQILVYRSHNTFKFPSICPFHWEQLEDLPQPEQYTRIQQYVARPPLIAAPLGLQTVASLATYQGLVHHLLKLHTEYVQDIGDPAQTPIARLWKGKEEFQDYYFYVASNGLSSSGFNIEMDVFSAITAHPDITFPDEIYLDLRGSYTFSIYTSAGVPSDVTREMIKNIWLSAEVSDNGAIHVQVTREELFNRAAVLHKVRISDIGAFPGQALAGEGLMPFTMRLKMSNSDIKCFQQTNLGIDAQGVQRMTVYIGCPSGKRLAFDISKTVAECTRLNKRYFDCPNPSDVPCFYYEDLFYPFFLIQDMVLGDSGPFLGSYTLKVVGGGPYSRDNIRYYTNEEILLYNSINYGAMKSLIWIYQEQTQPANRTKEGFTVLTRTQNNIRWICQKNSPCGDLVAQGLMAPDYYFIIEVSNKGVDLSTYCDYALRFEIHVHGFPLAPSRALYYFLISLATICALIFCYIAFHCCGPVFKTMGKAAYEAARQHYQVQQGSDISMNMDDRLHYY